MNFGSLALKTGMLLVILFLLSLAGAISFPALSIITGSAGIGITSLLFLLLAMLILSVVGYLLGRGIRTVKKPLEAFLYTYIAALGIGAVLILFTALNIPYTVRINLNWLGTNWYSPLLSMLFIGTSIILVFLVGD